MDEVRTAAPAPSGLAAISHAFGIEIAARATLPGLLPGPGPDARRRTALRIVGRDQVDDGWEAGSATRLLERPLADGSPFLTVDHEPSEGYRIEARDHGVHRLSADATRWSAWLAPGPTWRWQRLVFAQTLPVLATLHGVGIFHASGVVIGGRAYGLVAASGTGKSSVATHLIAGGATFLTDDVLALEVLDGTVVAHPGAQLMNVRHHELAACDADGRARLGAAVGESDKQHLRPRGAKRAVRLGGLFLLRRCPDAEGMFVAAVEDRAKALLGSAFAPHIETTKRLLAQLDVCAAVALGVTVQDVAIGADVAAADVAEHLSGLVRAA